MEHESYPDMRAETDGRVPRSALNAAAAASVTTTALAQVAGGATHTYSSPVTPPACTRGAASPALFTGGSAKA